jgi:peptidyl-prolyl cis-trans isomerase C
MSYLVNGQLVSEDLVRKEEARLRTDPRWREIGEPGERARRLRAAAEFAAVDAMIVEQMAATDPRPVDPAAMDRELQSQKAMGACRSAQQERDIRKWIDWNFRLQRVAHEMTAGARRPTPEEIEAFYNANRENFRGSAVFHAAHIVKHVDGQHTEEQARSGIEAALAELESGAPFAEVAERHSDCKGNGGDLGEFLAGKMVQEFEDAIRDLKPGQRTGIFRTPFGFHIAELRAKTPAGTVGFDEVREDIKRVLTVMRQHQEYQRAVAVLRSHADIRRVPEAGATEVNHAPEPAATLS